MWLNFIASSICIIRSKGKECMICNGWIIKTQTHKNIYKADSFPSFIGMDGSHKIHQASFIVGKKRMDFSLRLVLLLELP